MLGIVNKQPGDVLDYDLDFENWLSEGDSLQTASVVVDSTEIIVDSHQIIGMIVRVWLSSGVTGRTYKVTVTVGTSDGRTKEVDFKVRVRDY